MAGKKKTWFLWYLFLSLTVAVIFFFLVMKGKQCLAYKHKVLPALNIVVEVPFHV